MPGEVRYSLTRVCLRHGALTLPQPMIELFPDEGTVRALDAETGTSYDLTVEPPRTVRGLAEFFEEHDLRVNDQLAVRRTEADGIVLTARPRARRARTDANAVARAVRAVREGGTPMTEAELRSTHGLGADAPLEAALRDDPGVERRAGRWSAKAPAASEAAQPHPEAALNSARDAEGDREGVSPDDLGRAREAFEHLGFRVEGLGPDRLRLVSDMGRHRFDALVGLTGREANVDWRGLLAQQRSLDAAYLAVLGSEETVSAMEGSAAGAGATLWSWEGLRRAETLSRTVMIGPIDLEASFAGDGLSGAGLERFEAGIQERVAARGAFSDVITRLAALRAPAVFLLDDLLEDGDSLSREKVWEVVERLAGAPLQLVVRRGEGEYALRYPVADTLSQLASYATSLRDRLPDRTRTRVRGEAHDAAEASVAPGAVPEPLGPEELEASLRDE